MRGFWSHTIDTFKRLVGLIPYNFVLASGLKVKKEDGYKITRNNFYVRVGILSLKKIWETKFKPGRNWKNWQVQSKTIRRTRSMPRIMAAVLSIMLIITFPKMLVPTLDYAKSVEEPLTVYILLAIITFSFCGLIAFYMWLGYKAKPSGFDEMLRKLAKSLGEDKNGDANETESEENNTTQKQESWENKDK